MNASVSNATDGIDIFTNFQLVFHMIYIRKFKIQTNSDNKYVIHVMEYTCHAALCNKYSLYSFPHTYAAGQLNKHTY